MNLLITGAWSESKKFINTLKQFGFDVYFMENEYELLPLKNEDVDAVICNNLFKFHDICLFKNLKYIQLLSAGLDRFPLEKIKNKSITIKTARGVYSIPISEHVILGLLSLYRNWDFFRKNQNEKKWEKNRDMIELYGKKVIIFGCGSVGLECAKKLNSFGCSIVGVDTISCESSYLNKMVLLKDFNSNFLNKADVVVSALPLNETTMHFFNSSFFDGMKEKSIFVNVSRGQVVDEKALIKALKEKLFGAVLDVFDTEPLNEKNELWSLKNVFLTPHNSFIGDGNNERISSLILSNLKVFIS